MPHSKRLGDESEVLPLIYNACITNVLLASKIFGSSLLEPERNAAPECPQTVLMGMNEIGSDRCLRGDSEWLFSASYYVRLPPKIHTSGPQAVIPRTLSSLNIPSV